ncbi:MAG TPA: LamG-like jellyroll fold domain-containing protein [Opitutaceae bacterium]|nr:LamG-like jellyroll fold domain-containing protein [Opitutaceae bacterium]
MQTPHVPETEVHAGNPRHADRAGHSTFDDRGAVSTRGRSCGAARRGIALAAAMLLAAATLLATAPRAFADEIWHLDNLKEIGGHPVRVVGSPSVVGVKGGKAIAFDGAHDGIFVPSIPTAGGKAFTIEVLMSPAPDGPQAQRFFHVQDTTGRRILIEIRTNHEGGWWLDGFERTASDPKDHGLTLIDPKQVHPVGRWYWVALRYDGKRLANFVNGKKQLDGARDFDALGDGQISIGVRQNLVYWFKGRIREVRFHREAIPDDKLQRAGER